MRPTLIMMMFNLAAHNVQELYTWDRGNHLTYPTRYHGIGSNLTSTEKSDDSPYSERLGYDVS